MSIGHRSLWTVAAVALSLAIAGPSRAADAVPGLQAEKPADGVQTVKTDKGYMVPYTLTIPGTDVTLDFVPIPGGTTKIGSPDAEAKRGKDEGQIDVEIGPFWMAKTETTWKQYEIFMGLYHPLKKLIATHPLTPANAVDAITVPTPLYDPDKTYEIGQDKDQPAVTMTPYAAKQYTKWISKLTGQVYRLPCEAEWEHAARAGTTTAYFFGDDAKQLGDYAWFTDNSKDAYHAVGGKKPNPWGLYDIYGNVAEHCLDEYNKDTRAKLAGKTVPVMDSITWATKRYPRITKGGGWDSEAEKCRSAARQQTDDKEWKIQDPNLPKSPWWYTEPEAKSTGFRVIRPLNQPTDAAEMAKFWDADAKDIADDVNSRTKEGRGILYPITPQTAADVAKVKLERK